MLGLTDNVPVVPVPGHAIWFRGLRRPWKRSRVWSLSGDDVARLMWCPPTEEIDADPDHPNLVWLFNEIIRQYEKLFKLKVLEIAWYRRIAQQIDSEESIWSISIHRISNWCVRIEKRHFQWQISQIPILWWSWAILARESINTRRQPLLYIYRQVGYYQNIRIIPFSS